MISRETRLIALAAGFLAATLAAGCQRLAVISPPPIHFGQDVCAFCSMTIDDPRFAAALIYRTSSGREKTAIFDDIGCMLAWQRQHPADRTIAAFVHDYKTRQWIVAGRAWYVRSPAIHTPMGWGIAAGSSQADAAEAAPGSGLRPMTLSRLRPLEQNHQGQ